MFHWEMEKLRRSQGELPAQMQLQSLERRVPLKEIAPIQACGMNLRQLTGSGVESETGVGCAA